MHIKALATSLALTLSAAIAPQAAAETTYILTDRVLDVESGKYLEDALIKVVDGKIAEVRQMASKTTFETDEEDAKIIDMFGFTVVPGLIDMHVHLDGRPEYGGYSSLQFTDRFATVLAVANARRMLEAGFTTVRNLGDNDYNVAGVDQAIAEGWIQGPRIINANYSLGATGGHCDSTFLPPSFDMKSPAVGDSPDELRKRVREQRKYGAEVIKACATGGVFSRNTAPGIQQLTLEELTAIADETHFWGLRAAAHAHGADGIKAAIKAGFDTIEHASFIDDEGIRLAKQNGTYLSMDIFNTEYTLSQGAANGVLEENLDKERLVSKAQRDNFTKAHKAGVKMVFGSDAGVMPHEDVGGQLAVMVRLGMTPLEAIQAATVNAAEALGQKGEVGVIKPGAWADMIAVMGDPLTDPTVFTNVQQVIKGGQQIHVAPPDTTLE